MDGLDINTVEALLAAFTAAFTAGSRLVRVPTNSAHGDRTSFLERADPVAFRMVLLEAEPLPTSPFS